MSEIHDLEQQLRDLINAPRRHAELRSDQYRFSQLCSALDVVGDTETALTGYLTSHPEEPSLGELYLLAYGVLQVLVVQQDAVEHMAESLSIDYTPADDLTEIREVRNDAIGHPTRRGRAPGRAFNHISRPTLSRKGFDLLTFRPNVPLEHRRIELATLIDQQRDLVSAALRKFVEAEFQRETEHRKSFLSDSFAATFPTALGHSLEKVAEEIQGSRALGIGVALLSDVRESISNFEQKLKVRGELPAIEDVFAYHAKPALHALARLEQFLTNGPTESLNPDDAEALLFRLRHEVDAFRGLAREIDETCSRNPADESHGARTKR